MTATVITFEQARDVALRTLGPECGLLDEHTRELAAGWYFYGQSLKFLATRDWRDLFIGLGGFVVERETGRVFQLGTAHERDEQLRWYEAGYRFRVWDLTVRAVTDRTATVQLLRRLGVTYAVTEFESGRHWRIPRPCPPELLDQLLHDLPLAFGAVPLSYEGFRAATDSTCCNIELVGVAT
ncbi:MAG TPA: YrhB domain-containing protein [Tepidisphaeraceae bacterium]|nr:YrhB domain-containing protein [Tepidisphaeraceae bacterium]